MKLQHGKLTIRPAFPSDATYLCRWWNEGEVMQHAGFPLGLNTTEEQIRRSLENDNEHNRRLIVEESGVPVGEMNYLTKGDGVAEIGIKICLASKQNRG